MTRIPRFISRRFHVVQNDIPSIAGLTIMADGIPPGWVSTRIRNVVQPDFDPAKPRLGRRESEPHSAEITYLFDVLRTNFPDDRVMWDLHHLFKDSSDDSGKDDDIDIQYDVSFFRGLVIDQELPSYSAAEHGNRVPSMAVNIMSKSTWSFDLSDHADISRNLGIPLYVVFPAYHVTTSTYKPPFLRAYIYQSSTRQHVIHDLRHVIAKEGEPLSPALCADPAMLIDTSNFLPFRIGLMERKVKVKVKGGLTTWRMILVHPTEPRILQTRAEQETARADGEKARADGEKARADDEKARADGEKARADDEKARADGEKARADALEKLVARYRDKHGSMDE